MQSTATGVVINGTKATGVGLIATKVDIPSAIFFLVFFSIIHSLIVWYYTRKSDDSTEVFGVIDFLILTTIAIGSGMVFSMFGILSGRDEMTVYLFGIVGSLLGIKGITAFTNFFSKKIGIDLENNK